MNRIWRCDCRLTGSRIAVVDGLVDGDVAMDMQLELPLVDGDLESRNLRLDEVDILGDSDFFVFGDSDAVLGDGEAVLDLRQFANGLFDLTLETFLVLVFGSSAQILLAKLVLAAMVVAAHTFVTGLAVVAGVVVTALALPADLAIAGGVVVFNRHGCGLRVSQ